MAGIWLILIVMFSIRLFKRAKGHYPFLWTIYTRNHGWFGIGVVYAPFALYNDDIVVSIVKRYILTVHFGRKSFDLFPIGHGKPSMVEDLYQCRGI